MVPLAVNVPAAGVNGVHSSTRTPSAICWLGRPISAALMMLVLAGCSAGATSTVDPSTSPSPSESVDAEVQVVKAQVDCLVAKGWTVRYDDQDGGRGYSSVIDDSQSDQFDADTKACKKQVGWTEPVIDHHWTDEEWQDIYADEQQVAQCLRDEGYDVPEVPSFQEWRDRYGTDDHWSAYGFVPNVDQQEWKRLNLACPQPE